ncbi:matrixin family metalloprotease [Polyangium jinanense]|uniref:Matrixin family metalloprotease n=1 Tax=Polyangium jinanense TaxID=2829994 RepID=A0A9X3X221_9BACT|nr:matrixin family metalloprotease [Polyangium jinanense]MDC3954860.1 matrixin family metalloprotease [Polyangium jinanense]MDC3981370.1 matrixin family metalloprotease [Polyangium jinanense]
MSAGTKKLGLVGRSVVAFVLVSGALGAGCAGAPGGDEAVADTYESFEAFEAVTYREPDTGIYIVDGDTPVDDIKKLEEFYETYVQKGALIVHRAGGQDAKWNDTQKLDLTYCVSTTFGNRYDAAVQAIKDATTAWEAVANVKYKHVAAQDGSCNAQNSNVLFDVRPTNSNGQYLARAFFPGDSRSSRNVLIDSGAFGNNGPTTLTGILRHELGHTLGFRHEHTRPEAGTCFEDNEWRALTPYDAKSVMHYPQCNGKGDQTLSLTDMDKQGVVALYGAPGGAPAPEPGDPSDPGNPPAPGGGTPSTKSFNGTVNKAQVVQLAPVSVVEGTTFDVTMTGKGDPDLYVHFGAQPAPGQWTCRPYKTGPNESCSLTVPPGETEAFIAVRGYNWGQYQISVTYTAP